MIASCSMCLKGRFLRFYLGELHRVVSGEWFAKVCLGDGGRDADSQYEDILTNVAEEVYQIICCAFTYVDMGLCDGDGKEH